MGRHVQAAEGVAQSVRVRLLERDRRREQDWPDDPDHRRGRQLTAGLGKRAVTTTATEPREQLGIAGELGDPRHAARASLERVDDVAIQRDGTDLVALAMDA